MSGIEIAGLALGAFPLLLKALESYRKGAEVLKNWWQIQRAYTKCKHDIEFHHLIFQQNIERVLASVVDDEELRRLMDDPGGRAWTSTTLESKLRAHMLKSYSSFVELMQECNGLMELLKKELGISNVHDQIKLMKYESIAATGGSVGSLTSTIEYQTLRIKFTWKRSSRDKVFGELQTANDRMRMLLDSNDKLSEARQSRQIDKSKSIGSRRMNDVWLHATCLYTALSKAWRCDCTSHIANLRLQHRVADETDFGVLFERRQRPSSGDYIRRNTKIETVLGDATSAETGLSINFSPAEKSIDRRQVQWANQKDRAKSPTDPSKIDKIESLCDTLASTYPGCFGFLEHEEYRFMLYPEDQVPLHSSNMEMITLEKLLNTEKSSFTRRKRYWLALILASSFLQLYSTPWLSVPLQKHLIVFRSDPSSNESLTPYLRKEMTMAAASISSDSITTLGVRLLELCFGIALERSECRLKLPAGDTTVAPFLDHAAAIQWSNMVNDEAGPEYADAIKWCLNPQVLNDQNWKKEIRKHVIDPLEYCHKQLSQVASVR